MLEVKLRVLFPMLRYVVPLNSSWSSEGVRVEGGGGGGGGGCEGGGGWGGGGGVGWGGLWRKFKKKSFFERFWGENGHNSINIKVSALKSLAFDREPNFG